MNTTNQGTSFKPDEINAWAAKAREQLNHAVVCGAMDPAGHEVVDTLHAAAVLRLFAVGPDKDKIMTQIDVTETVTALREIGVIEGLFLFDRLMRSVGRRTVEQVMNEIARIFYEEAANKMVALAKKPTF